MPVKCCTSRPFQGQLSQVCYINSILYILIIQTGQPPLLQDIVSQSDTELELSSIILVKSKLRKNTVGGWHSVNL